MDPWNSLNETTKFFYIIMVLLLISFLIWLIVPKKIEGESLKIDLLENNLRKEKSQIGISIGVSATILPIYTIKF